MAPARPLQPPLPPLAPATLTLGPNHAGGHQQQDMEAQDQQTEAERGADTLQQKGRAQRRPCPC